MKIRSNQNSVQTPNASGGADTGSVQNGTAPSASSGASGQTAQGVPSPETGGSPSPEKSTAADRPGYAPRVPTIAAPPAPPGQATQTATPSVKMEAVRAPSLSLPKGGGALRSLGDTFKTNPSTGTGSYGVSIPAPSARGMGPSLTLSYDSGSGNGAFGLGWNLSLGSVSRRTDRALPWYDDRRDGTSTDTFVLSGAEDLVPEHPAPPEVQSDPIRVIRYLPRTESGFSRIEKHTVKATGKTHWVVRSGDGSVHFYGRTENSRITDPFESRNVFSWLLDRVQDDRGNVMEVRYAAENLDGVDSGDCSEFHRNKGGDAVAFEVDDVGLGRGNAGLGGDDFATGEQAIAKVAFVTERSTFAA